MSIVNIVAPTNICKHSSFFLPFEKFRLIWQQPNEKMCKMVFLMKIWKHQYILKISWCDDLFFLILE